MGFLVHVSASVPATHYVVEKLEIPSIRKQLVGCVKHSERIDVTTHDTPGNCRESLQPDWVELLDYSGKPLFAGTATMAFIALRGGGTYYWVEENGLAACQTFEEFLAEQEAERERELEEMFYY